MELFSKWTIKCWNTNILRLCDCCLYIISSWNVGKLCIQVQEQMKNDGNLRKIQTLQVLFSIELLKIVCWSDYDVPQLAEYIST